MSVNLINIDLSEYGIDKPLNLKGEVIDEFRVSGSELIFLFDENHIFYDGIKDSLRNAIKLIDEEIVDFVGVEGLTGKIQPTIEKKLKDNNLPDINIFLSGMKLKGITDEQQIDNAQLFCEDLFFLRPETYIYGVEDLQAHQKAGESLDNKRNNLIESGISNGLDVISQEMQSGKKIDEIMEDKTALFEKMLQQSSRSTDEFIKNELSGERPKYFVENYFKYKNSVDSKLFGIINAGKQEQDKVCNILREKKDVSFIRIRPIGFPDIKKDIDNFTANLVNKLNK